ncbi:MAG: phosphomannomutase [Lachnospiraceae bacterium]|nr:phosphomannomutase [Lachnospiraceae bacterium]
MNNFDYKKIRVVAMDLDGTLTQHKSPLTPENRAALDALGARYKLLMVGAGQVMRIFNQMKYPIDIIGNYGMQFGTYDAENNTQIMRRDVTLPCDRDDIDRRVSALRERYGYTQYRGENVEFHPSGCLTFPLLGTAALQEDKLAFDPDRKKRRAFYKEVCAAFPEYRVFVGGSSSFDMAPAPYDKYYALDLYCRENGLTHDQAVYIGDDYGLGGNDEAVYLSDFPYLTIDDYRDFPKVVKGLLDQ